MKILDLLLYTSLFLCLTADAVEVEASSQERLEPLSHGISSQRLEILPQWFLDFFQLERPANQESPQDGEVILSTLDQEILREVEEAPVEETPEEETPVEAVEEDSRPVYVYGEAVPMSEPVSSDYFGDAVIIGDSRCQGLMAFGGMSGANYTGLGLSVYNLWEKGYISYGNSELTVLKALETQSFAKVYIGLGINSVGYPSMEKFYSNYSAFIDEIRLRQPEAVIYVQNIIPLNEPILQARGSGDYFNNNNVQLFNSYIQTIAQEKDLYYLDLYSFFLDENGQLPPEAGGDGIHLNAQYAKIWAEYLHCHIMDEESYRVQSLSSQQEEDATYQTYPESLEEGEVAAS